MGLMLDLKYHVFLLFCTIVLCKYFEFNSTITLSIYSSNYKKATMPAMAGAILKFERAEKTT